MTTSHTIQPELDIFPEEASTNAADASAAVQAHIDAEVERRVADALKNAVSKDLLLEDLARVRAEVSKMVSYRNGAHDYIEVAKRVADPSLATFAKVNEEIEWILSTGKGTRPGAVINRDEVLAALSSASFRISRS